MVGDGPMVLGYACSWWTPRRATWSYTASRLRDALDAHATVVDIETQQSLPVKAAQVAVARLARRPWQFTPFERALVDRAALRGTARAKPDAVVEIADVDTTLPVPHFPYQDMSLPLALASQRLAGEHVNVVPIRLPRLEQLAERAAQRLNEATGVLAMSQWLADDTIARGVPADRVRVVHAGLNSPPVEVRDPDEPPRGRLLFVGVDFVRKGGDVVVEAARQLRAGGLDVTLTVVGPRSWPLPGEPPEFVRFLGHVSSGTVARLLPQHDAFVLPSRFEAYGIAFVEALAAGLPCVAYDAYAMPELVENGVTGRLVSAVETGQVAAAIAEVLSSPAYYANVAQAHSALLARHDWHEVAARIVAFVGDRSS